MKKNTLRTTIFFVIAAIMILVTGCTFIRTADVGDLEIYSKTIEFGDADSVIAKIMMGAGELKIAGGANELLEAEFTYNVAEWKPEVKYNIINDQGQLTVQQPSDVDIGRSGIRYEWDLRINNNIPIDLSIMLGAGSSSLDFRGLSLTKLDITTGVGKGTLDLAGGWERDLDVSIKGGVGEVTLLLPKDVGVRVDIAGGIGNINAGDLKREGRAYVNDVYGESDVTLKINITGGIGQINLELGD